MDTWTHYNQGIESINLKHTAIHLKNLVEIEVKSWILDRWTKETKKQKKTRKSQIPRFCSSPKFPNRRFFLSRPFTPTKRCDHSILALSFQSRPFRCVDSRVAWMSRCWKLVYKWLGSMGYGYGLLINGVYWGLENISPLQRSLNVVGSIVIHPTWFSATKAA